MNDRGEAEGIPEAEALRLLAESAARAGGAVARSYFRRSLAIEVKSDGSEVTEADRAAQIAILDRLRRERPNDAWLAEERLEGQPAAVEAAHSRVWWVIDPIDGTRNFVRGIPLFCCSVGVLVDGVPRAGAIYDAVRDDLYSARHGGCALLNGAALPSSHAQRRPPLVAVPSKFRSGAAIGSDLPGGIVIRNLGSTALHLAMVASGQLDAAISNDSKLWDIAAGACLIEAAGGTLSALSGEAVFPVDPTRYRGEDIPTRGIGTAARSLFGGDAEDP